MDVFIRIAFNNEREREERLMDLVLLLKISVLEYWRRNLQERGCDLPVQVNLRVGNEQESLVKRLIFGIL